MGRGLWEVVGGGPGRREASGRRYPLPAILAIAIAAMLGGRTSLAAIARWGRRLDREACAPSGSCAPGRRAMPPTITCSAQASFDRRGVQALAAAASCSA